MHFAIWTLSSSAVHEMTLQRCLHLFACTAVTSKRSWYSIWHKLTQLHNPYVPVLHADIDWFACILFVCVLSLDYLDLILVYSALVHNVSEEHLTFGWI